MQNKQTKAHEAHWPALFSPSEMIKMLHRTSTEKKKQKKKKTRDNAQGKTLHAKEFFLIYKLSYDRILIPKHLVAEVSSI